MVGEPAAEMRTRDVDYGWRPRLSDSLTLRTASLRFHRDVTTSVDPLPGDGSSPIRDRPADQQRTTTARSRTSWRRSSRSSSPPAPGDTAIRRGASSRCPAVAPAHVPDRLATRRRRATATSTPTTHTNCLRSSRCARTSCTSPCGTRTARAPRSSPRPRRSPASGPSTWRTGRSTRSLLPSDSPKLEILRIGDNRLSDGAAERLVKALGQRVELGTQHPDSEVAARRRRFRAIVDRVIAEENEYGVGSRLHAVPHAPWAIMQNELAVPEAVPSSSTVSTPTHRSAAGWPRRSSTSARWRRRVRRARPAQPRPDCLGIIDPERARALRVDRARATRSKVCRELGTRRASSRGICGSSLDDDDPEVVAFALGGGGTDQSFLAHLLEEELDLVPVRAGPHAPRPRGRRGPRRSGRRPRDAPPPRGRRARDRAHRVWPTPARIRLGGSARGRPQRPDAHAAARDEDLRHRPPPALAGPSRRTGAPPTAPHRRSDHPARGSSHQERPALGLPRASFASFGRRARAFHRASDGEPRLRRRHVEALRACGEAGLAAIDEALFNAKGDHARHLDFAREAIRQGA